MFYITFSVELIVRINNQSSFILSLESYEIVYLTNDLRRLLLFFFFRKISGEIFSTACFGHAIENRVSG